MNLRNSLLTTALLAVIAPAAMAADSATLEVKGVIKPSPCIPVFTGNGAVFDYGDISSSSLNQTGFTGLGVKTTTLTITCNAAIKVALKPVDNRTGTSAVESATRFGLGVAPGGAKLGFYTLMLNAGTRDGIPQDQMFSSSDNGATWARGSSGALYADGSRIFSQTTPADSEPQSGTVHVYNLQATTTLARADSLPLTSDVQLDGNATIEVIYL